MSNKKFVPIGFTFILLGPATLAVAPAYGLDILAFIFLLVIAPAARLFFGDMKPSVDPLTESIATFLHWLPVVYAPLLVGANMACAHYLASGVSLSLFASCFTVNLFALPVAHELIHRRARSERLVGAILAAVAGYPFLCLEHITHHSMRTREPLPRREHNAWGYARQRLRWIGALAIHTAHSGRSTDTRTERSGLFISFCAFVLTASLYTAVAGVAGLVLYGVSSLLVSFAMQVLSYIQHWGLHDHDTPAARQQIGWEDLCAVQAWLTLNIAYHAAHHKEPARPFYRLTPCLDAPKQAGGYALLLFAALVPPLWRKLMDPLLDLWLTGEHRGVTAGRSFCYVARKS